MKLQCAQFGHKKRALPFWGSSWGRKSLDAETLPESFLQNLGKVKASFFTQLVEVARERYIPSDGSHIICTAVRSEVHIDQGENLIISMGRGKV